MQGWYVSVEWIPLEQTKIETEAECGKVSFDVPASRLALWWQVEKGRCSLESTRVKSLWQGPVPNPGFSFLF